MPSRSPERIFDRKDLLCLILAILVPIFAALLTVPVMESGVNDDWSYTHSALEFAKTGRFVYNGWATAMLGAQIVWGALFIKLFGFSFTMLHLSLLPFAVGSSVLLYLMARRAGICHGFALLTSLTIIVSPVFLPLITSFMTDVTGLFFLLLGLYALICFDREPDRARSLLLLLLAGTCGVVGGSVRQPVAMVAIGVLPYCLWRRRQDRSVTGFGLIVWAVALLLVRWETKWFASQPYSLSEDTGATILKLIKMTPYWIPLFSRFIPTLVLMTLPVVVMAVLSHLTVIGIRRRRAIGILSVVSLAFLVGFDTPMRAKFAGLFGEPLWPYWGDLINTNGIVWNLYVAAPQFHVPMAAQWVLIVAVYLALSCVIVSAAAELRSRSTRPNAEVERTGGTNPNNYRAIVNINIAFIVCYLPLIPIRLAMVGGILLDRYLIPLLPVLSIVLLHYVQSNLVNSERARTRSAAFTAAAWIVLGCLSAYSVAFTHDFFSACRSRLEAADLLRQRGVPRTEMSAGFDYDCWTQLEETGYVLDTRISNPPGILSQYKPQTCRYQTVGFTQVPSIHPRYVVLVNTGTGVPLPIGLTRTDYPAVTYRTWLPPFSHTVEVLKNDCW